MKKTMPSPFNLEKALEDLESIVSQMEKNTLGIESSLAQFEKGIQLIRTCQQALQQAEQKVQLLTQKDGELILTDYLKEASEE
jgi:exodeoxyribonuclease VII small subunit